MVSAPREDTDIYISLCIYHMSYMYVTIINEKKGYELKESKGYVGGFG